MNRIELLLLDGIFFVVHTLIILLNVFGGLFPKTRRLNLVCMSLTLFSWLVLGYWFGWGYCICTHWHWQVRQALGIHDQAETYNQLLVYKLTGWLPNATLTANVSVGALLFAIMVQVVTTFSERRKRIAAKGQNTDFNSAS